MQAAPLKTSILHCPCGGDVAPTGSRCAGQSSPDTGGSSATCLVGVVPCPCQYWPCTVLFCLGCATVHLSFQNYLMANKFQRNLFAIYDEHCFTVAIWIWKSISSFFTTSHRKRTALSQTIYYLLYWLVLSTRFIFFRRAHAFCNSKASGMQ